MRTRIDPTVLTVKRSEIMDFVVAYYAEHRYPPTVREIGKAVGLSSTSTVHVHLQILERQGRITHDPKVPRSILVVPA